MRTLSDSQKCDVARDPRSYLGFASVAASASTLVCAFLKTDQHLRTETDIMVSRSTDGGFTWDAPRSLSHLSVRGDGAVWVTPQISSLRDGRLVIICDRGVRRPGEGHVSLYHWQAADRGMSNWLFWSDDAGETWSGPRRCDEVGGEPSFIRELEDGTLLYTRTKAHLRPSAASAPEYEGTNPPYAYYASELAASTDRGQTWQRRSVVADDPLFSDAEVALLSLGGERLMAFARCCDHGSFFGQPSNVRSSDDGGRTWSAPRLLPFYGHRIAVHPLPSGRVLATFRNAYGTIGTYALLFDPGEALPYAPNSCLWQEDCCRLEDGALVLDTDEGYQNAAEFILYPAQDDASEVEMEWELRLDYANVNGCCVSAGVYLHFTPDRVFLGDKPEVSAAVCATGWHRYRALRKAGILQLWIDGQPALECALGGLGTRMVRFGNRVARPYFPHFTENRGRSYWRSLTARVANVADHSIHWNWNARSGFPDQFRRDRMICLDRCERPHWADNGYSGWALASDGSAVVTDYTAGYPSAIKPFIRAYHLREEDFS